MCIRCSELGIPAAIGVGSNTYEKVINSKQITLIAIIKNNTVK